MRSTKGKHKADAPSRVSCYGCRGLVPSYIRKISVWRGEGWGGQGRIWDMYHVSHKRLVEYRSKVITSLSLI